ncbi:MAG: D-alanyl-D-alanine carboxypeptidase [Acetatifactor sp.]|nr:D-alanyl-D-alanine carboxypeptidase [Acetatifactor sp.]
MTYSAEPKISSFDIVPAQNTEKVSSFAEDLCVVADNLMDDEAVDMSQAAAAALFDLNDREVLYAKNVHDRLYPASLTKIMTALVAIQHGSPDQILTATSVVNITETGATLCGVKSGDTMTLDQALHLLLMYSANDVAMLIAENIGGSVEGFVEMMNEEALRLGATNTHFVNPHGLSNDEHYTTAYDLYLIFNEAIKYETFSEIVHMTTYQTTYYDRNGKEKPITVNTTNQFLKGKYDAPESVTVIGGKTGTTNAAKSCLILLSRDVGGAPYISVILKAETVDILYAEMADLLEEINK